MRPAPTEYIRKTRENYEKLGFEPYRWFHAETEPAFATPTKRLADSTLGMISTAGTYVQGQVAYHYRDDTSVRAIPNDTPMASIRFSHIMENYLVEARLDPATVFPSEVLAKLNADGVIGGLADDYYSCMGGIYSQKRAMAELIPNLTEAIAKERIDLLLLVPL